MQTHMQIPWHRRQLSFDDFLSNIHVGSDAKDIVLVELRGILALENMTLAARGAMSQAFPLFLHICQAFLGSGMKDMRRLIHLICWLSSILCNRFSVPPRDILFWQAFVQPFCCASRWHNIGLWYDEGAAWKWPC